MPETCDIDLRVQLPRRLADEVERVNEREPEMLRQILMYGMARRAIFDHLVARGFAGEPEVARGT